MSQFPKNLRIFSHKLWWDKKYGKDKICPINHTRLRPRKKGVIKISCGHTFYRTALKSWLKNSQTCPMCRSLISSEEKKRI